jgi:hypothetical protein
VARLLPACLVVLLFGSASSAAAQDISQDPSESARFHFGAIRFTPYLVITDLGVDTNVYNEADGQNPKQDTTATLGPGVDYWFKLGRARIAARSDLTYTWFRTYDDQRSFNTDNKVKVSLPLNRLTPFVDGVYDNGRRRVSYEIDSRSYSTTAGYGGGLDTRVTAKSTIRVEGHHESYTFREDEFFAGVNLANALDRDVNRTGVSWHEALTPLTTFSVNTEYEQDRFEHSAIKDSDGFRVMPGFEFDPLALIAGKVYIGYRHFNALDASVPDYSGLVADVAANYRVHATKFDVLFARDITYSYETAQPYYLLTNVGMKVLQKVTTHWDLTGNLGRQWLGYRDVIAPGVVGGDRLDRSYYVGGGVGYEMNNLLRVGVEANYYQRTSDTVTFNDYNGLRVGAVISYGLPSR